MDKLIVRLFDCIDRAMSSNHAKYEKSSRRVLGFARVWVCGV